MLNIIGSKYGRLTVLKEVEKVGYNRRFLCRCACGKESVAFLSNLRRGHTTSCGCYRSELRIRTKTKHGAAKKGRLTQEYIAWTAMKGRCRYKSHISYSRYGGRGVTVCKEWVDDFEAFLTHIGPAPGPEYSLDRIDSERDYEPGNVRWATQYEQQRNRRDNIWVTIDDQSMILKDWARELGVDYKLASARIISGWDPVRALLKPPKRNLEDSEGQGLRPDPV